MDTLRMFFALAAKEDLHCKAADIKNAFTALPLKEDVWFKPFKGVNAKKGYAFKGIKSLYGLKQAARNWNQLLRKALLEWGFTQSQADPCLYIHLKRKIWLLVYVDDIAIAAPKKQDIKWF